MQRLPRAVPLDTRSTGDIHPIRCYGPNFTLQEPSRAFEDVEIEFEEVYAVLRQLKIEGRNITVDL